jgi:hypothetical protein
MGFLDSIREIFGFRAEADSARPADPEDLFGMSTAYVTMHADLDFDAAAEAALCFADVDSTDFQSALQDVEDIMAETASEMGTETEFHEDTHGYDWVVFSDPDFEDLVNGLYFAADTFVERDYGSRLLAAVFAFEREGERAYWVYSFRRGSFYPFVPADPGQRERDSALEFKLQSVLDGELSVEEDERYWYPLWPGRSGGYPWE